jgi:hypothetical protein
MSLTSLLRERTVRREFYAEFKKPILAGRPKPIVGPLTQNYSLVGTAFDYAARMFLRRKYGSAHRQPWVAETTVELVNRALYPRNSRDRALAVFGPGAGIGAMACDVVSELTGCPDSLREDLLCTLAARGIGTSVRFPAFVLRKRRFHSFVARAYAAEMQSLVSDALACEQRYISGERVRLAEICRRCLQLAQIDPLYRVGIADPSLGDVNQEDVDDLCSLLRLFSRQPWLQKRRLVLLNPTFKRASALVGGADADLVLDDMLVDIKCTKHRSFSGNVFHQLLGCYILSRIGGIEGAPPRHRIRFLAVYFARHGELYRIPVNAHLPDDRLRSVTKWFRVLANTYAA